MSDQRKWRTIYGPQDRGKTSRVEDDLVPQQATLPNIVAVIQHHELPMEQLCTKLISNKGKPVAPRIVGYYRSNARLMGFLDRHHIPTPSGRALLRLTEEQQIQRMAYAFEASEVGRAWLAFQGCIRLEQLAKQADTANVTAFVQDYLRTHGKPDKENETTKRRVKTLRSWLDKFVVARLQVPLPGFEIRPALAEVELPDNSMVLFDSGVSGRALEHLAQGSRRVEIASAYFSLGGYSRVAGQLDAADMHLLIGNDERSGNDVRFLLQQFAVSLEQRYAEQQLTLDSRRTMIRQLHDQLVRGRVRVRRFEAKRRGGLHAKVYIFDRKRAHVGSANMSTNGLANNVECGRVILDMDEVAYLVDRFKHYFELGLPFSEPLLREIELSWALWEPTNPELVLLKILDLLFGQIQPVESRRYQLAQFQQAIVATVLRRLESQDRVLLIAPTGIGKTVMGAYVAAALRNNETIDRVVLVCKNQSMRDMWIDALRSFRLPSDVVRTYDLERTPRGVTSNEKLAEVFAELGPKDLVIVDECHHYRRETAQRQVSLRELLMGPSGAARPPKALLMTATPISTGVENLQTLLDMATPGAPAIKEVSEVARHRGAVNVSLGQVLRDFGVKKRELHRTEPARRAALFSQARPADGSVSIRHG